MREQISSTTSNLLILVFYFCVINHYMFSSLNNIHLLVHSLVAQKPEDSVIGFFTQGLKAEIKVLVRLILDWRLWGRTDFQVHAGCCRIQFLATIGLKFHYFANCQPRAALSTLRLPAFLAMWFPPSPQAATENHSHLEYLSGFVSVYPVSDIQIQS